MSQVRRHLAQHVDLRSLLRFNHSPARRWFATRAALAIGLPVVVLMATGWGTTGFLTSLGAFSAIYGAGAAVRHRARVIGGVGAGLTLSALLGALTAGLPWVSLPVMVTVTAVAGWALYALRVGPPGAFFFALGVGVANLAVAGGASVGLVVGMALVGAVSALVLGTSDAWFRQHGVEEAAVAHARRHVERFAAYGPDDPGAPDDEADEELDRRRADASSALHQAWTAVTDGGRAERLVRELEDVHRAYVRTTARVTGRYTGVDLRPWDAAPEPTDEAPVEAAGDLGRTAPEQREVEDAQVRTTSLGRPSAAYLLRQAASWPSESLLVAGRLALACLLAGSAATLIDNGHVYWAVAFAALIVTAGGSRRAQATKALHRVLGTAAGLGVYAVLLRLDLQGWALVAVVIGLQFCVEMVVTRHYALAVSAITPLALTISAEVTGMPTETVVGDRVLDTVLGVGSALLVLVASGLFGHEVVLRAHARRVAVAVDAVLERLVVGRSDDEHGRALRQELYVELLESDAVARRALADAPGHIGPYREMERTLSHVGYLVLGAAWHPQVAAGRDRFARARDALAAVIGRPVRVPRPADELDAELREVERELTGRG